MDGNGQHRSSAAGGNFPQCHKQRAEHFFCWSFVRAAFQMWLLEGINSFKDYHYHSPVAAQWSHFGGDRYH